MSKVAWAWAAFGCFLAALIRLAIWFDVRQVEAGRETISRWCLNTGSAFPMFAFVLTFAAVLIVSGLAGHLWFPRSGAIDATLCAIAGGLLAVPLGVWLGHVLVGQA
jgi:hypothetical protein